MQSSEEWESRIMKREKDACDPNAFVHPCMPTANVQLDTQIDLGLPLYTTTSLLRTLMPSPTPTPYMPL